ncbi:MAG: peptidoglycan-binding domain-containing protein [Sulfitobacter sp.]
MFMLKLPARGMAPIAFVGLLTLAACETPIDPPGGEAIEPGVVAATRNGPDGAAPGTCWGRTVSPAIVESVTQRIEVTPAKVNPDGTVATPPVYRNQDQQVIVTPRKDNWFETLCPDMLTIEFVSTLQRALQARNVYDGAISGTIDAPTRAAIQKYQQPTGPISPVLSLESARSLGLIAVPRTKDN